MFSFKAAILAAAIIAVPALSPSPELAAADKKADKKNKKKPNAKPNAAADQLTALFKKLDTDKNGKLSPAEFAKLKEVQKDAKKTAKKANKANKKNAAKKANKANKAGKKGKKQASKSDELFKKLDTNKDGSLSPDEFKNLTKVQQEAKTAKKANKTKKKAKAAKE